MSFDVPPLVAQGFANDLRDVAARVYANALAKGWYDSSRSDAEAIAMVHCELSEFLEALRSEDPGKPDKKCPDFSAAEVEMADAVIRLMDLAMHKGYRLGEAILAKHAYNLTRPYKHGKRF